MNRDNRITTVDKLIEICGKIDFSKTLNEIRVCVHQIEGEFSSRESFNDVCNILLRLSNSRHELILKIHAELQKQLNKDQDNAKE